jgi:hypothetical protein
MKNLNLLFASAALIFAANVNAQDFNDVNFASHTLAVDVPEIALLDIYDVANTGEATNVNLDMIPTVNQEAGLYTFAGVNYTGLYLNYTSVVADAANASGFDLDRTINVMLSGQMPGSVDLVITPVDPVLGSANGGTVASAGTKAATSVKLGVTNPLDTDVPLVNSIESVYTGDGAFGVALTYTLEQNGNFAAYNAGTYDSTITYTLTDL